MIQHVESASARLTKKPRFGGLVLSILGLGTFLSTAIFVVVYSPFLRALPSSESERLVRFWQMDGEDRFRDFSSQELDALVAASSSFDAIAGISFLLQTSHDDDGRSGTVTIARISPGFFEVFRVEPVLGRAFTSEELRNGAPVVILGDRFWSDFYSGDPDVLGRRVTMYGREYTVIGVMPAEQVVAMATVSTKRDGEQQPDDRHRAFGGGYPDGTRSGRGSCRCPHGVGGSRSHGLDPALAASSGSSRVAFSASPFFGCARCPFHCLCYRHPLEDERRNLIDRRRMTRRSNLVAGV